VEVLRENDVICHASCVSRSTEKLVVASSATIVIGGSTSQKDGDFRFFPYFLRETRKKT